MDDFKTLSRPRYFDGQLLTANDFRAEQDYFLEKNRRHNRSLHGCGTVWGLEVSVAEGDIPGGQVVVVNPGFAIDRNGNEILVPSVQQADLPSEGSDLEACVYLCYEETLEGFVPVPGSPESGETSAASRTREDFKLCLVTQKGADCECPFPFRLAKLRRTEGGWRLDHSYRQPRLRRIDEKTLLVVSALGAAVGMLVGFLAAKR